MKPALLHSAVALAAAVLVTSSAPRALAQGGSLTPPGGAPAPTMKTLDQIEPRTPISSLPFTISSSGSYYLTGNLSVSTGDGITVTVDRVTLDLNGFTISSTASPASGSGITTSGFRKDIIIRNGNIRGATTLSGSIFTPGGWTIGILFSTNVTSNIRVEGVTVRGIAGDGIQLSENVGSFVVERCMVSVCSGIGIMAHTVRGCSSTDAGLDAIFAQVVTDSDGTSVGTNLPNDGIEARVVENCTGTASAGTGIDALVVSNSHGNSSNGTGLFGHTVNNCRGTSVTGAGLVATVATNCIGISSTNIGLDAESATNCYGESTGGAFGMRVLGTANSCRGKLNAGTAISAGIAIGCTVSGTGIVSSSNKFLGTPP